MKRSAGRILTTHVGSLPRPADLLEMNSSSYGARSCNDTWSRNGVSDLPNFY